MMNKYFMMGSRAGNFCVFAVLHFCLLQFFSCAPAPQQSKRALYQFQYQGESYHILSISSSDVSLAVNRLVGENSIAVDYDQDGFIDKILTGKKNLLESQKIYSFALQQLASKNRLREAKVEMPLYRYTDPVNICEIKSFQRRNEDAFNEIKVIRNAPGLLQVSIGIDRMANGAVDEISAGRMTLKEMQTLYTRVVRAGLAHKKLIKTGSGILVRK